ncbi:MAG: NAD(P)-dependent oxidoreductase [Tepidisphaeraceae bacterium]
MGDASTIDPAGGGVRVDIDRPVRRRVLITGAAGNIGSYLARDFASRYELRLMVKDQDDVPALKPYGEVVLANVTDFDSMKRACDGIDTVVHLAASASPDSTWDSVLNLNLIGTYHTFAAAKACGCRRVVYASSIHAVSGYPADVQVKPTDPVNPGDLYGVSKCFGEALARYMAEQEGLSCIAIRIGAFQPLSSAEDPSGVSILDAFVSERDLAQLIQRCIDVENLRFAIFNGLSGNRFNRLDISSARELLGYAPQDDATRLNAVVKDAQLSEKVKAHSMQDESQKSGLRETIGQG